MDLIIQKATELTCQHIKPTITQHTTPQNPTTTQTNHKQQKWQTIAIQTIKQCHNPWLPKIHKPTTLQQQLNQPQPQQLTLLATLQPNAPHPRTHLQNHQKQHQQKPKHIAIWIGPEGDLTPTETQTLTNNGAQPTTLGPNTLRSETATIYLLSILNYELQTNQNP